MKPQINTDEHGAAQPQPKLWSTVLFGVRQLAAAFLRVEFVPSPSRRKQACALQRRTQECWSFAKSFSAASASQRTTPMILSRRQFSKTLFAAPFVLRAQQEPLRAHVQIDTERVLVELPLEGRDRPARRAPPSPGDGLGHGGKQSFRYP